MIYTFYKTNHFTPEAHPFDHSMKYNFAKTMFLTIIAVITLPVSNMIAAAKIEGKNTAILVTGRIEANQATNIIDLGGSSSFTCFITIKSPRKFEGQRVEILIADMEKSNLPKLAKNGDLIALRLGSGALDKNTDFIYDSEITDAFNPSALPEGYVCVSELDRYHDLPSRNRPKLPKVLKDDPEFTSGIVRYLVLINEQGKVHEVILFYSSHPELDTETVRYINSTNFKIGKKDRETTGYYQYVVAVFRK